MFVRCASWLLERTFRIGGALGIGIAANVFVGMVESPLLVRPISETIDRGELFVLMTAGMSTVAGTVMVLYASILGAVVPDARWSYPDGFSPERPRCYHNCDSWCRLAPQRRGTRSLPKTATPWPQSTAAQQTAFHFDPA